MAKKQTSIYVSISIEDDQLIDEFRIKKIRNEKKHYTKTKIVEQLILKGIDVEKGKYLELDPSIDDFVSKLQELVITVNNEKVKIKKSKQQVYHMLIEKGLQHLDD